MLEKLLLKECPQIDKTPRRLAVEDGLQFALEFLKCLLTELCRVVYAIQQLTQPVADLSEGS